MMWKSDSCLQLDDRREEALTLALACVKMIKSTNTILLALNTALHMCPPEQVTEIFFSLLKDCPSGLQSPFEEGNLYPESVDYLSRLMLGCQVLAECTASNLDSCCLEKCDGKFRDMIKSSFLIHWMQNYLQYRTSARIDLEDSGSMDLSADQADGGKSITIAFCDVLLELFSGFLKINLVVRDSSKNDTFAQASNAFDLDMSRYDIACSARHIRNCLFVHLKHLLIVLEESKDNLSYNPPVYHKLESIVSVAELSWNLGVLLSGKTVVESQHDYLQLAIDLLELSERLFYYLSTKDSADQHEVFRFKCLLSSTSLRLDLSSSLSKLIQSNTTVEEGKFQEKSCIESEETQNISQLSANIEIMSQMCDFIQQTDLLKLHMILTLAVYCRTNNSKLEAYVDMNQNQFLTFTPQELEKCADIAQNERYGNLVVCRKMLQLGIQVLARDAIQDFPLLGSLYKRLIQISPNRLQVKQSGSSVEILLI